MSFLTPIRLQDASRVLRGVALVAAKAAADSPIVRRVSQGDIGSAVQEALKAVSQQTKQVGDALDTASQEQTGATVQQHLRRGQEAAETVASALSERTQGAVKDGQQAAQSASQNADGPLGNILYEGRRILEGAAQSAQETAQSLRQDGPAIVENIARQSQQTAEQMFSQGRQGFEQAAKQGQATAEAGMQQVQQTVSQDIGAASDTIVAPDATAPIASTSGGNSLVVDFAGGSGEATGGSAAATAAVGVQSQEALSSAADSSGSLYIRTTGQGLHVRDSAAESGPMSAATERPLHGLAPAAAAAEGQDLSSDNAAAEWDSQTGPAAVEAPRQPAMDATEVLRSRSASGRAPSTVADRAIAAGVEGSDPQPESRQPLQMGSGTQLETAQLAEEERRLSEQEAKVSGVEKAQVQAKKEEVSRKLRERRVPSSAMGRAAGFAQLGASLVYGTVADQVMSYFGGGGQQAAGGGNRYLTERNAERLADALCRMRGAALKLGQMISIQDENVLPPQLSAALERVRAGADVMPKSQLHKVLAAELGPGWRSKVADFEDEPLAAASIGQVHGATLHDGRRVVLKIQYPGVARSIESDVDNLLRIISLANLLPKGMYIENAAKVAKRELKLECDYRYEARCQMRFVQLIADDEDFRDVMHVPAVIPELCSASVLCSEWVPGVHIDKVAQMPQAVRDAVGTLLLQLTLRELFQWRFMQTDPNWGNFLYDEAGGKLHLIDFGAAREFPVDFVDDYLNMVRACAEQDRQGVIDWSTRLGFLTGDESKVMLDAHSRAGFVVGTPFSSPGLYDFAQHNTLTKQVSELGAVMLKHRLTPPPEESYSLHRKLSGAFLACIKLRARVPCRQLFYAAYDAHKWGRQGVTADSLPELELASG